MNMNTRKNVLDLNYSKYLQYFNTCVIIIFTYLVGLTLAIMTAQIDLRNSLQVFVTAFVSVVFFVVVLGFLIQFHQHLRKIPVLIRKLGDSR